MRLSHILALIVLLASLAVVQAAPASTEDPDVFALQSVSQQIKSNQTKEALAELNRLIKQSPKVGDYYRFRASILLNGEPAKAIDDYCKAIELNYDFPFVFLERAQVFMRLGRWREAIADCTECLKRNQDPKTPTGVRFSKTQTAGVLLLRAQCYLKLHQYSKALPDLDEAQKICLEHRAEAAVELDPAFFFSVLIYKGTAYSALKDYVKALSHLDQAIPLYPKDGGAFFLRGEIHFSAGNLDKAERDLLEAARLLPKEADVWDALARVEVKKKKWRWAMNCFRNASESNRANVVYPLELAVVCAAAGKLKEGLDELRSFEKRYPSSLMPRLWESALLFQSGRAWEGTSRAASALPLVLDPSAYVQLTLDSFEMLKRFWGKSACARKLIGL
jgi:tetratricopeptide (TPR) repeat protein